MIYGTAMNKVLSAQLAAGETPRWQMKAVQTPFVAGGQGGILCVTQERLLFAYLTRPRSRPAWSTPLNQVESIEVVDVGSPLSRLANDGGGARRQLLVTLRNGETGRFSPLQRQRQIDSEAQKLRDLLDQ
jgi:hypothetical protein